MLAHSISKLLASAAFANPNTVANLQAPSVAPLVATLDAMAARDGDEMLKRAPDMAAMVPYWDKTDAIIEGADAVRLAAAMFLPRFVDEDKDDYEFRLSLTKFTNVYRDIVEGLASKPFEEEISLTTEGEDKEASKVPEEFQSFIEDVDGAGNNLTVFASHTFFNGINSAIDWIMVDYPTVDATAVRTLADQKALGIRPFWSHVLGRNVLEVRTRNVNGKQEIVYIRVFEPGVTTADHVRIMERDEANRVTWQLWVKTDNSSENGKTQFVLENKGTISIGVIPMVPFITGRRDGASWKIFPAMQDAADLQINLYRCESGLEYVTNLAGYPTLVANGLQPEMMPDNKTPKKLKRGPSIVLWGLPDGNGNHGEWALLEPNAASMKFLQEKATATKQDLRELGRQPLTAQSGNLTVITTAVAAGKARSAVSAWALGLKDALENALKITGMWFKSNYEPQVNVYNEFDNFTDGGADLAELGNARRAGDISRKTYLSELKRRKVLSPEFNFDNEAKELLAETPGDPDLEGDDDVTPPTRKPTTPKVKT